MKKYCVFCGKEFEALTRRHKYCSYTCFALDNFKIWKERERVEAYKKRTKVRR